VSSKEPKLFVEGALRIKKNNIRHGDMQHYGRKVIRLDKECQEALRTIEEWLI